MANFCTNCGMQVESEARFCVSCGKSLADDLQAESTQGAMAAGQQTAAANQMQNAPVRGKKKISIVLILISLLIIVFGIQSMSLNIIGKTTTANITRATRDTRTHSGSNLPDPNRFNIVYEFYSDGELYTGSANHIFKKGISSNQTIRVLYMPFWPGINDIEEKASMTSGLIMVGLGVFLFVLTIKGKARLSRRY